MTQQYGYICFWKGQRCEVYAATSYAAQCKAETHFTRCRKRHEITVVLAEKDGKPVTHTAVD
jgi:hypothetical protein